MKRWHLDSLGGVLAVTATYVYFLLFAQYGFLRLLDARLGSVAPLETVMAAMGIAGLAASLAAGALVRRARGRTLLRFGFTGAGLAALASFIPSSPAGFLCVAAAIGAFTGLLTVTLASRVRELVRGPRAGLRLGLATGLAYFICNLPGLFAGPPELQTAVAVAACALGLFACPRDTNPELDAAPSAWVPVSAVRPLGVGGVILAFGALIWLDSGAFAMIQQNEVLRARSWSGARGELTLGAIHLIAAVLAGVAIDRRKLLALPGVALAAFVVAIPLLQSDAGPQAASWIYVAGISLYSVALVAYPSSWPDEPGVVSKRWRAALLFGFAGWIGSALGVGMARDLGRIPAEMLWLAIGIVAGGWLLTRPRLVRDLGHGFGVSLGVMLAMACLALLVPRPEAGYAPALDDDTHAAERGREVYLREGCNNCHSQYVRAGTHDVEWWGPARGIPAPSDRVLIGNRRQGPDLANVGNRRSAKWHRLHLIDPRSVSPGSRMPSYAHLFEGSTRDGEDLVAYLSSLGMETAVARRIEAEGYPHAALPAGSLDRGGRLFTRLCTPCHGVNARGDGPLSRAIDEPALDLLKRQWFLLSWGPGAEPEDRALARVIKFGIPGSSMPGHETLADDDVADLVTYLQHLRDRLEIAQAQRDAP